MLTFILIAGTTLKTKSSPNLRWKRRSGFISKYSKYNTNNCFLDLHARIKNIEEYYNNLDNLEDDEQPYAKTMKQEEINRVMYSYSRKKKSKKSKL